MKIFKLLLTLLVVICAFCSCNYNFLMEEYAPTIDPDDPDAPAISFTTDLQPIFDSKCISCHKAGGNSPNLESSNAYSSVTSSKYMNTATPTSSLIYTFPLNGASTHGWMQYSATEAVLVLAWIQQGAKEN